LEPILQITDITKTFPGVKALDGVCLNIYQGEIHTLLGENGAGKSTLMNVLNGLYKPDSGHLYIDGKQNVFMSPKDSIRAGIGMVHQHFMLVRNHSVLENILLSVEGLRSFFNKNAIRRQVEEILQRFDMQVELDEPMWKQSIGTQQWVELIKLLIRDCRILILDEPTAVLTPQEAEKLFVFLQKLRSQGKSVIFISHKMREVMALSDRVTILKKGATVKELKKGEFDENILAKLMIGGDEIPKWERVETALGEEILHVNNLSVRNDKGLSDLDNLSLVLKKGEILGIAGIAGNGQKALAEVITGLRLPESGSVTLNGEDITECDSCKSCIAGIAHVPEDRKSMGIAPDMTVEENLILKSYKDKKFRKGFLQNKKAIRANAEKLISDYAIKAGPQGTKIRLLSGGNIQKVIIARELSLNPCVLVALYPTRGLDIGSAEYVHKVIAEAKTKNMSTILISEDLDELLKLSDRIAVMFRGAVTGEVFPDKTTREEIGLLMSGERVS
jgi:simple sugar transport system ATP-binding protein